MQLEFSTYDVFTQTRYAGNPLAIVWDADALASTQMQAIAAEFNLSETTFICSSKAAANTANVRIFTPTHEMQFAGHPNIGTAIAYAERFETPTCELVFEELAGLVPLRVAGGRAALHTPIAPHILGTVAADIASAHAGIPASQIKSAHLASAGAAFLIIELDGTGSVDLADPSGVRHGPAAPPLGHDVRNEGVFVFATDEQGLSDEGRVRHYARMFAPNHGIAEDPATGSAAAALAAVLAEKMPQAQQHRVHQGVKMGRPSVIDLTLHWADDGTLRPCQIAGHAVKISHGILHV